MLSQKDRISWRQSLHMIICLISGLMCLLPIMLDVSSNLETDSLRVALSTSTGFNFCCASCIALVVPLLLDVLFDLRAVSVNEISTAHINQSNTGTLSFTFLNIPERLLILMGMIILPVVIFLPESTENLGLIYLCFVNCQLNLVGGTILLCLSRYDKEYWSERSTSISIFSYGCGLASSSFVFNTYAGEYPPSRSLLIMYVICYFLQAAPVMVFLFNSIRWLIIVYCKIHSWKGHLMCGSKIQSLVKSDFIASSSTPKHTFFPMVYTVSVICITTSLTVVIEMSPRIERYTSADLWRNTLPYLLFLITISILSMRMVKFDVIEGLVSANFLMHPLLLIMNL